MIGFGTRLILLSLIVFAATPARADFAVGLAAYERGDYRAALEEWRTLAEGGNAQAQYRLGRMYADGNGVPKEIEKAVDLFRKSAAKGYAPAQIALADAYQEGLGVPKNPGLTSTLWMAAIMQGYAPAKFTNQVQHQYALELQWERHMTSSIWTSDMRFTGFMKPVNLAVRSVA